MIPILTPILPWQHGELTLIPAKSFHKHGVAGLGLSGKIETALLKTTPGFLALSTGGAIGVPSCGSARELEAQRNLGRWGGLWVTFEDLMAQCAPLCVQGTGRMYSAINPTRLTLQS